MRVVLDSNLIVERDWHLTSTAAAALLAGSRRGRVQLVLPEVVLREVITGHADRCRSAEAELMRADRKLRRLKRHSEQPSGVIPRDPFVQQTYESWLREKLHENRVRVAPIPDVTERLLDRALRRRRPFDGNGRNGFRDALIWETVLADATEAMVTVLATDNSKDFADRTKSALHTDLLEDLAAMRLGEKYVRLAPSMQAAAQLALEPATQVVERLIRRLEGDDAWAEDVVARLHAEVDADWIGVDDIGVNPDIETAGEPFLDDVTDSQLDALDVGESVTVADAFPLTDEVYAVQLEMPGEASYTFDVSTSGFWNHLDDLPPGLEVSPDDSTAYFSGSAAVTVLFDARYNDANGTLSDISLVGIVDA